MAKQPACHKSLTAECYCPVECCWCHGPKAICEPNPCTCKPTTDHFQAPRYTGRDDYY